MKIWKQIESNWDIPQRYLRLTIEDEGGKKTQIASKFHEFSKVSFNTTESMSGSFNECNITINGMLPENMTYLATTASQWTKNPIMPKIVIDAGYYNKHSVVFSGSLNEAIPKIDNADYSITIKAMSEFPLALRTPKSYTWKGKAKVSSIVSQLAVDTSYYAQGTEEAGNVIVEDFSVTDQSIIDTIRQLATQTGLEITVKYGSILYKKPNEPIWVKDDYTISEKNLVGTPQPTPTGVKVTVRLDPQITTGQVLNITSKRFAQLNSDNKFVINTVQHSGDTQGAWTTTIQAYKTEFSYIKSRLDKKNGKSTKPKT